MTEIPVSPTIRILIPGKYDHCPANRFFISRDDVFLTMCSQCGGTVNIVYHVPAGESKLLLQNKCTCHEKEKQG